MIVPLCIGVFSSIVAVALAVTSLMRSEGTGAESARLIVGALGVPPILLLLLWGVWELLDSLLSIGLVSSHPLQWAFWIAMGVADLGLGLALATNVALLFTSRMSTPERRASLVGWRRRTAPVLVVLGVLELVTSVVYAFWL